MSRRKLTIWFLLVLIVLPGPLVAEEPQRDLTKPLEEFSRSWKDEDWQPSGKGPFTQYLRPENDAGWQVRMKTLQAMVGGGRESIELLLERLREGGPAERILAAQALGFFGSHVPRESLLQAAKGDEEAAVRLYAVDSLGMLGGADLTRELTELDKAEKNKDVKRHIAYALERQEIGLDPQVVQELRGWDAGRINTAKTGEPAPDFELSAVTGEKIRLSDFRGKQAVVLVFIYGDT